MSTTAGILDAYGWPVSAERVRMEKVTRFNPLRGWTPEALVRQLTAYHRGELASLAWVMEWLERHDDVISCVATKAKAAVSRHGFDIVMMDKVRIEEKGMAEEQCGLLREFYQNIETTDALELEEAGGMRLLVQQVMDGYGKGYAAHHVIWRPSASGLRASLVKVPTWFFEAMTGKLRLLPTPNSQSGVDLETLGGRSAWLVSRGRGVMLAGVLARMFKQLPLQDWLTYCDRHGMPAFLGKTAAQKGSAGWRDMTTAVGSIGSEFGAVINSGDLIEVLNLTGRGELPYPDLVERMDRAQVMLWRGGDLSTMSRESGTGSNAQSEATAELDCDNAAWVSETMNQSLTRRVISWYFGEDAPTLCKLQLRTKAPVNASQDMSVILSAAEMGVRVSVPWFLNKLGIVAASEDEKALGDP